MLYFDFLCFYFYIPNFIGLLDLVSCRASLVSSRSWCQICPVGSFLDTCLLQLGPAYLYNAKLDLLQNSLNFVQQCEQQQSFQLVTVSLMCFLGFPPAPWMKPASSCFSTASVLLPRWPPTSTRWSSRRISISRRRFSSAALAVDVRLVQKQAHSNSLNLS